MKKLLFITLIMSLVNNSLLNAISSTEAQKELDKAKAALEQAKKNLTEAAKALVTNPTNRAASSNVTTQQIKHSEAEKEVETATKNLEYAKNLEANMAFSNVQAK